MIFRSSPTCLSVHGNKAGPHSYALDPSADLGKIIEWKTSFMGNVRISEKSDVGDSVVADEEIIRCQVVFHQLQRSPTAVAPGRENCSTFGRIWLVLQPKTRGGDVGFVAILLEEEPLKHFSAKLPVLEISCHAQGNPGSHWTQRARIRCHQAPAYGRWD
jgi:hypothetical protein